MDVVVQLTVPDYLYQFYIKVAESITNTTPEESMARALYFYSGIVAEEMMKDIAPESYEEIANKNEA